MIDISQPVRYKNPQKGEEDLVFAVVNFNEMTNRCIIQVQNLPNWDKSFLPTELVSVNDIVNIEQGAFTLKCRFKGDPDDILYHIVNENESRFEIVAVDKYDLFTRYEARPEREFYSEWIEKDLLEIIR